MRKKFKKQLKIALKKIDIFAGKLLPILMLIFVINLCFPHVSMAKGTEPIPQLPLEAGRLEFLSEGEIISKSSFPEVELREPQYTYKIWLTAYNSRQAQTDATPCITASGFDLCEHNQEDIIATNFLNLPFGAKVRFPELYGDKIFIVQDRMNARYWLTADIWLKDYAQAKSFGRKWTSMEILPFVR
ncbi:3D domain-containing protein [Patescibacteria group bacterium]|nr:3D domain-containing protein [Patescibacteria group bacterium]